MQVTDTRCLIRISKRDFLPCFRYISSSTDHYHRWKPDLGAIESEKKEGYE
jgi:hypothetical protein